MEQVGDKGCVRWELFRADLYYAIFFCLTNYVPVVWAWAGLKLIVDSMSNLERLDAMCWSLYGLFLMVGLLMSVILRIRPIFPRLESWAKLIIGELIAVSLLCCWIAGMNFWFWVRTQGAECRTSADGPLMDEYCGRAVFKLAKELSKYQCLQWMVSLPNWILTVSAGIYGYTAVWQIIKERNEENTIPCTIRGNRNRNPPQGSRRCSGTATEDKIPDNNRKSGTSMEDGAHVPNNNGSGSTDDTEIERAGSVEEDQEHSQPLTQTRRRLRGNTRPRSAAGLFVSSPSPIGSPRRSERLSLSGQMRVTRSKQSVQ